MEVFELGQDGVVETIDKYVWVDVWIGNEIVFLEGPDLGSPIPIVRR